MKAWVSRWLVPLPPNVSSGEKLVSGFVAFIAILALGLLFSAIIESKTFPFLVASVGAATVLVFAVPHSPLSQPWPVIGGHLISATVGVSCQLIINDIVLASAMAVSLSIIFMYFLRCLHPPGGAAALGAVWAGPEVQTLGFEYVIFPVTINAILLVIIAMAINRIIPNRNYPASESKKTSLDEVSTEWALGPAKFKESDIQAALQKMDSYVDVSHEDLVRIYALASINYSKRRMGDVRCRDIMQANPFTLRYDDELEIAWQTLRAEKLKAAPIVDAFNRPLGIVTITDFVNHASGHSGQSFQEKLKNFLKRSPGHTSDKTEVVGQIMSSSLIVAKPDQHIMDLVSVFTEQGFHHLPIIDENGKIIGMVTRSDVMRSLLLVRS